MKSGPIIFALIMSFVPLSDAFPQDKTVEGEVSVEGILADVDGGEGGKAKFTKYKDLKEDGGFYGRAKLKLDTEKYFLNFHGGDFAYETQYYKIDGGMWGKFKVDLFYDEIPNNLTFDARTPFSGEGSDTLTGTPNTNVDSWNTFDYSILRHQYGGGLKVNMIKPFFFDLSFQRENRDGTKPTGASETSPGGIAFELPEPVDYITNNLNVQFGYSQKPLFLALNYFYSDFDNSNTALNLPANFEAPRAFSLPPDNSNQRGTFKGAVNLPFNTKFSTNIALARNRSDTSIVSLIFSDYRGKVDTQNYDFALTSNPFRFLDAKVYYKYYKRDNRSDDPAGIADIFLDYNITTYGGDLGFRLPLQFYLSGGYKYVKTKRDKQGETDPLEILPYDTDNIFNADLRWTGLDFMEARVGYELFDRDANYQTTESKENPAKRYYYASQNRNTFLASIDVFPIENLDFGLEYRYSYIGYTDTRYGLKNERRHDLNANADYTIGRIGKVYGYGDYGWIRFGQMQSTGTGLPWEADQKDRTWGYGIGAEAYVIPQKLTLIFQHDYLKSNGNVDFTFLDPALFAASGIAGANNDIIDIMNWDDSILYCFKIKAVYNFTKSLSASLGYAFERFKYSDAQLNDYNFVPATTGTNGAYLTGAYKDQSYRANLLFAGVTYRF